VVDELNRLKDEVGGVHVNVRARIVSFDSTNYLAVLRLDGSAPQTVTGVRVSRDLAAADMAVGRRVLIDPGASGEADEWVVFAVWTA
jgi:hypothetical protein